MLLLFGCLVDAPADSADPLGDDSDADTDTDSDTDSDSDADADADADADTDTDTDFVIGPSGRFTETLEVDGIERSYTVFVPEAATSAMETGPVPVLVALHGAGDTAENFLHATGLETTAGDNALLVVAPTGYNKGWFVQTNEGWPGTDGNSSSFANDIYLLDGLLEDLDGGYRLDAERFYLVGHSRGAGMTALVLMGSGQIGWTSPFAAYGVNAGYDPAQGGLPAADADPKRPAWVIHGGADTVVPTSYGEALADDLDAAGFEVTYTEVSGAGHTWLWRSDYGQTNQDLVDWLLDQDL